MKTFAAAAITTAALAACSSPSQQHDNSFLTDASMHGNVSQLDLALTDGGTLGDKSCDELRAGKDADYEVLRFANTTKPDGSNVFTAAQSKVIVYWAITDLCPDQMSKRRDTWVNVTSADEQP